jgi:hypothetical protein
MSDKKIDEIAPKGLGFYKSKRSFPLGEETVRVTVINRADGTVDKGKTKEVNSNNIRLESALQNEKTTLGKLVNEIAKKFASPSEKTVFETAKKIQKMKKGGKVVKKTSTVKRSSNGKAKQPVKKTTRRG